MRKILIALGGGLASLAAPAAADVISGPPLTYSDLGYDQTGLAFAALSNSTLTSFTFQSQGQADTITLTDLAGNVLNSVEISAGSTTNVVNVSWDLLAGSSYRLLQNVANNGRYAVFGQAAPSGADIALTSTGVFHLTGSGSGFTINGSTYWADFNNITTSAGSVPEPATWAMMLLGFGGMGLVMRGQRRKPALAQVG